MEMGKMKPKKMRGFMCNSTAATAVCMTADPNHSAIVSRKPDHHYKTAIDEDSSLTINPKYSRLVHHHHQHHHHRHYPHQSQNIVQPYHNIKKPIYTVTFPPDNEDRDHHQQLAEPKAKALQNHQLVKSADVDPLAFQVVLLRVHVNCKGCADKVKKHISKMQGVTSVSTDREKDMVTVKGHVSPLEVLKHISKVKRAEILDL